MAARKPPTSEEQMRAVYRDEFALGPVRVPMTRAERKRAEEDATRKHGAREAELATTAATQQRVEHHHSRVWEGNRRESGFVPPANAEWRPTRLPVGI
jgi:hypothetical protein